MNAHTYIHMEGSQINLVLVFAHFDLIVAFVAAGWIFVHQINLDTFIVVQFVVSLNALEVSEGKP